MSLTVAIAIALLTALAAAAATGVIWKHPTPLDRVLCELPPLRLPRRHASPGTAAAAPAAVPAMPMTPRGRHHASQPLGLVFDRNRGEYRHAETGPMAIASDYGTARRRP